MSDEELFIQSLTDPTLFTEVVRRYEKQFLNRATRMIGSREAALDLVQDTFVKLYIQGQRFTPAGEGSFRAWAYTVLIRTTLSYLRRLKQERLATVHFGPDLTEQVADPQAFAFDRYAARDFILSVLSRVPLAASQILSLHFLDGLTTKEIAVAEGLSERAVRTRLSRAKQEFKRVMVEIDS